MSVNIEQLFSCSHLILSHVWNWLSAQTTCMVLCVGSWSLLNLVKAKDAQKVAALEEINGEDDVQLEDRWDHIKRSLST